MNNFGKKVKVMKPVWLLGDGKVMKSVSKHYQTTLPKSAS